MNLANARSFGFEASKPCLAMFLESFILGEAAAECEALRGRTGHLRHRDHRAEWELEQVTRCGWSAPSWMQLPRRVLQRCG